MYKYIETQKKKASITEIQGVVLNGYKEIINDMYKDRYKYLGYLPIQMTKAGMIEKIELVFEKIQ